MTEKPTNVLSLVRDDVDHTRCYRLAQPSFSMMGTIHEPKAEVGTAAGTVYATTTCKVVLECAKPIAIMTADEARKLSGALLISAGLADERENRVKGLLTRRIVVTGNSSTVTFNGSTMALRKQRYAKPVKPWRANTCHECRQVITTESWVSERFTDLGWGPKKRVGEIRICLGCYPKLIVDNAPIALVEKP